jgi:hypothetical protein
MIVRKEEFLALKQRPLSVSEYRDKFLQMSRYAPEDVNTDAKRKYNFLRGLVDSLHYQLMNHTFPTFQHLVDRAIMTERKRREMENTKCKIGGSQTGSSSGPRCSSNPPQQFNQGHQQLSPHFIGPFLILKRVGEVAYQLELPNHLADVHNVFHVSQLKKCLRVPEEQLPMEDLSVHDDMTYAEYSIKILHTLTWVTRNKVIKMFKVQWSHHGEDEATWEREEELHIDFPHLFHIST